MKKSIKIVNIVFAIILAVMFVLSVVDIGETRKKTSFSQENMLSHIEKLSENGPRSIVDKEANEKALEYLVSEVEKSGAVNENTTAYPAYMIQSFVASDDTNKYQNFYLKNLIVHIPANAEKTTGEAVMFMGHYDSVPMGQGASDDGVACATMLEAIRYYTEKMENGYTISNDLVFCFVNGEEYNLFGSRAFMEEFNGFDNVVERIKFGANLESRGTDGTLIMFETSKNNYNTVKLFSEVNKNIFTCSVATMIYDMMPNGTDFSNFKEAYQGVNMANIGGGENYHTQNDSPENVEKTYLSQQAEIVDSLIDKLGNYELEKLYDANESAIFFSYLNVTTVVYNHTMTILFGIIGILMIIANILLSILYRKQNNIKSTAKALLALMVGFLITAALTYACYYLFQLVASLFGVIDIHMIGTITYSNTAIILGIGILSLAISVITTYFACKWLKIDRRAMTRAFAYIHMFLGIVLSFALADASYLFIFSGIMLMLNELLITAIKKVDISKYHGELLVIAFYWPIIMPLAFLASSALGLTMAYIYGLVFAFATFVIGIAITPLCEKLSIRLLINKIRKKESKASALEGGLHIFACSLLVFLVVSVISPNASVNLQGKQNIIKLPYDDALVYVCDESGENEYRIYDLNAYKALKKYAPKMKYEDEYYRADGEEKSISLTSLASAEGNTLKVKKNSDKSLVYLDFKNVNAHSFTVNDGITSRTYEFGDKDTYSITLHSDCIVIVNGGSASVEYKEVLRDYEALIPSDYDKDNESLHFNLWLTAEYNINM
ncbi:MAG: M28 family peptidase [Clostridia bacterium]|nr:M28 family peptidase [Clostridia bacterium]